MRFSVSKLASCGCGKLGVVTTCMCKASICAADTAQICSLTLVEPSCYERNCIWVGMGCVRIRMHCTPFQHPTAIQRVVRCMYVADMQPRDSCMLTEQDRLRRLQMPCSTWVIDATPPSLGPQISSIRRPSSRDLRLSGACRQIHGASIGLYRTWFHMVRTCR